MTSQEQQLDLNQLKAAIWHTLETAVGQRGHEWRTPVLATVDHEGLPQARTVVLRDVDTVRQELRIFTDHRSPKIQQIRQQPRASLLFWSKTLCWQVRMSVDVKVITEGPDIDAAWDRISKSAAAQDYLTFEAPGSPLPGMKKEAEHHAMAILVAQARELDWLELTPGGHRRALLSPHRQHWLVP